MTRSVGRELGVVAPLAESEGGLPGPAIGEPVVTGRGNPFRALRHREFRTLFGVFMVGDLGFWIAHISLQVEMVEVSDESSMWVGLLFFTMLVPMLLFAPVAGVVTDRVSRKRLLISTRLSVAAVTGVLSVLMLSGLGSPWVLAGLAFGIGTSFAFMGPVQYAATANAVPVDSLTSAITLEAAGANVSRIAGPALAAPILALWGPGWGLAVYSVSSLAMAASLGRVHLSSTLDTEDELGMWGRWRAGLQHARERPPAMALLVTMAVYSVFGAAIIAMLPIVPKVLGRPRDDFVYLVVATGVGAVAGSLHIGVQRRAPTLRSALMWVSASGVACLAFAASRSWSLSLVLIAGFGFCYFSITTTINSILQHLSDDEKRGRIMSLFSITWGGLIPFGGIWMGVVSSAAGIATAVAIGAAICVVYGLGTLARVTRSRPRGNQGEPVTAAPRPLGRSG